MFLACGNLLINFYCICCLFVEDTLRKVDFYFVFAQTVVDFSIGGVYSLLFGLFQLRVFLNNYCQLLSWLKSNRALQFIEGTYVLLIDILCQAKITKIFAFRSSIPGESFLPCRVTKVDVGLYRWESESISDKMTEFFVDFVSARGILEQIPHNSQCCLMLGMAAERYLLICHAAWAKQHYRGWLRVGFYVFITTLFIIPSVLPVGDAVHMLADYEYFYYVSPLTFVSFLQSFEMKCIEEFQTSSVSRLLCKD